MENFLFFAPRTRKVYPIKPELLGKFEPVRILTKDCVKLYGWFIKPKQNLPIIMFCHGQSENISKWQDSAIFLEKLGFGALFFSYRGHYKSAGRPSEEGIYMDAETMIDFLKKKGCSTQDIVIWGRSLGSCIACEMALRHNLKGIILESSILNITSASTSLKDWYIKQFNLNIFKDLINKAFEKIDFIQKFENDKKIEKIKCPILIIHSQNDVKIHYSIAQKLHKLNPQSTLYISDKGEHNTNDWCFEKVNEFLVSLSKEKVNI